MKVSVRTTSRITIEAEGDTDKEVFEGLASGQEVFSQSKCGLCGCEDLRFVVRKNKDDEPFYEIQCQGVVEGTNGRRELCRAYLYFGQNKKGGGLFPIRALTEVGKPDREKGKFGKHNGWTKYRGEPKEGTGVKQA